MEQSSHARCKTRKPKSGAVGPQGAAPSGLNEGSNCGPKSGKRSGNERRKPIQHGLASKHRWSKVDLSKASRKDLELRVLTLQSDLENLRRQRKSGPISTDKSGGAIKPGKTEKISSVSGVKPVFPKASSEPSIKNAGVLKPGTRTSSAPNVTRKPSTHQASSTNTHRAQSQPLKQSFATVVKSSPPQKEAITQTAEEENKRRLPQCFGASTTATKMAGPIIKSEDAIFKPQRVPKYTRRPTREEVHGSRNVDFVSADASLSAHLARQFLLEPRDNKLLRKMKLAAEKWFRTFDTSEVSDEDITNIIIDSCTYAMRPNQRLVLLRNSLKDRDVLHDMAKHNAFVEEGKLKSSWTDSAKNKASKLNPFTPGQMSLSKATK